ncbi:5-Methylcytosine G/T mismatch-specific DNA glycosylase [Aspergillus heteromorphus CBS 117.55]|uniref:5-Methylcytosine G/T mismatch-specific DNA glycosylase n=1 Tax=Aspergillus heteromorphus CBS 117.55 TaxID=1448321 RepID=A0A317V5C2_9EURO|nr:5-Methylcytosine G/T mismatch-specific DNA glycosylase [Aspergillus heteromorphus CBS 117.55]PWY69504.1 5-Methylcytosine G/T mismatch-specific DNA glycosylase [Aspergillus heteromorphus CBS 117.55]
MTASFSLSEGQNQIPENIGLVSNKRHLPSTLLSTDSDLSDVPGDFDNKSVSSQDSPLRVQVISQAEEPMTPTKEKITGGVHLLSKVPRPKIQKISPYFPKPLIDPDSCLPFPPIDAPSFGLVQEQLAHDPFRLLIATIFLNRTRGSVALPVLFQVFDHYPTVEALAAAEIPDLASLIHCLGFQNQRAKKCVGIAQIWLACPPTKGKRYRRLHYPCKQDGLDVKQDECIGDEDPRIAWEIAHLPGVGPYSLDSWRIFCRDKLRGVASDWKGNGAAMAGFVPEWKSVLPQDKELRAYLTWMWLKEGWVWDRHTGKKTLATARLMRAAHRGGVAHEENGNWVLDMSPVKKASNGLTAWS